MDESVDLTLVPWNRLAKLAPPGTTALDLQAAADRWSLKADVYNAAADLWEEKALTIEMAPDATPSGGGSPGVVKSVSQDGVSVTYASDGLTGNNQSTRISQLAQINNIVRRLRKLGKGSSPLVHDPDYDPWLNIDLADELILEQDRFIVVDEV